MTQKIQIFFHLKMIPSCSISSTKYFAEASSINFARSCKYGLEVLGVSLKYRLAKMGFKISLFSKKGRVLDTGKELNYYNKREV